MTLADLPFALHGLCIVALLVAWFYCPWQVCLIALSRERLIELRSQWITLTAGELRHAERPAALTVVSLFDAQIRSLPCMSLQAVLLGRLFPSVRRPVAVTRLDSALRDLPDDELREIAGHLQEQAAFAIVRLIVMRSLVCTACAVLLAPALVLVVVGFLAHRAFATNILPLREEVLRIRSTLLRKFQALTDIELPLVVDEEAYLAPTSPWIAQPRSLGK